MQGYWFTHVVNSSLGVALLQLVLLGQHQVSTLVAQGQTTPELPVPKSCQPVEEEVSGIAPLYFGYFFPRTPQPPLGVEQLQARARQITVQVLREQHPHGSGILVSRQGTTYTVLTSAHLFQGKAVAYQVRTSDGKIYPAHLLPIEKKDAADLRRLQFQGPGVIYSLAQLNGSPALQLGDQVFAAGFPIVYESSQPQVSKGNSKVTQQQQELKSKPLQNFQLKSGQITLLLPRPLEGGYQIGFSNDIFKGFSGGPLLNMAWQVIGINGLHAQPLLPIPFIYEDGAEPSDTLQRKIAEAGWAIPVARSGLTTTNRPNLIGSPYPVIFRSTQPQNISDAEICPRP